MEIRKIRGPVLDLLYARLKRCSDLACTGKPFTEHRNVPCLEVDPADSRPAWQQVADAVRDAISAGTPGPGEPLPSVREMHELQGGAPRRCSTPCLPSPRQASSAVAPM